MDSIQFLQNLVDQTLCYALKSSDMDLYDFGFVNADEDVSNIGEKTKCADYILHVTCRFKIIWRNEDCRVERYYEDTGSDRFSVAAKQLLGLKVVRVALSEKNDLWLDFGDCWLVFATFENSEESWRLFTRNMDDSHLIATNLSLEML